METRQLIKEATEKQGVSRYRLAKELGVKPSAVYHWESGRSHPNGKHLMELLRRAGRLAAMVLMVSAVSGVSVPQDAAAADAEKIGPFYTLYAMLARVKRLAGQLLVNARQHRTATALAF